MKNIFIFDLDETVVDSKHRTPNHPDGTLNLDAYLAMKSRETIFRDTLLPLARVWRWAWERGDYVFIATAREMGQDDYDFLVEHDLDFHSVVCRKTMNDRHRSDMDLKSKGLRRLFALKQFRNCPKYMFDDAKKVRARLRQDLNIPVFDSIAINRRLGDARNETGVFAAT